MKLSYGRQNITDEDIAAVVECLHSDFLTQGPQVQKFEEKISALLEGSPTVAVANGTAALHLLALSLEVQPGDVYLAPPITFAASTNCIRYCGGEIEFVDIDPKTLCLSVPLLQEKLEKNPHKYKGIVAVNFAGYPMRMDLVHELAQKYSLNVIEDNCHALGAKFQDGEGQWHPAGSGDFSDGAVFSFHPVKHIATGEGGLIATKNLELHQKLMRLRTHGINRDPNLFETKNRPPWHHEMIDLGYNYRISDILCALGVSQLSRLKENLACRQKIAGVYRQELKNLPLQMPPDSDQVFHAYHLFVVQTEARDQLYQYLASRGIHGQVHYIPVYHHPYYRHRYGKLNLPVTEHYFQRALSIPMYHSLSEAEQDYVITALRDFFK